MDLGSAYGAGGAADALQELVKQRMLQQELSDREQQMRFDELMRTQEGQRSDKQLADQEAKNAFDQKLAMRKAAQENLAYREGQPESQLIDPSTMQTTAQTGLPQGMQNPTPTTVTPEGIHAISGMTQGITQPLQQPATRPISPLSAQIRPTVIPGIGDIPDMPITPQTAEAAAAQKLRTFLSTPQKLGKDEVIELGGQVIARGPAGDKKFDKANISINGGKPVAGFYDPTSMQYYDDKAVPVPRGSTVTEAPGPRDPGLELLTNLEYSRLQRTPLPGEEAEKSRLDKSWNASEAELKGMETPITDHIAKVKKAINGIDQMSPAADSLLAEQILTAMAGGTGTGLRMSEPVLERIIKGRSVWQNMVAAAQQYNLNPSKALSIPLPQRQQLRALLVQELKQQQQRADMINTARRGLIDATDVTTHRNILAGLYDDLNKDNTVNNLVEPGGAAGASTTSGGFKVK